MPTTIAPSRRWTVVILLSLGMIIAYIDRANLSVALAVADFKNVFQLSDSERGLLNSAFFWTYAFLQVPAGFVADRYGVRRPYAISFLFWSLISAATALSNTFWQLLALRMALGVGEAIVTPASLRWIRLNVTEKRRGLATGIFFAGAKIGPALGTALATQLILTQGWRPMFVILGLGCLVWLVPWLLLVKDDDREIEAAEKKASPATAIPFSAVMKTPAIYGIIIGTFAYNYFNYFCMTWLPAYLVEHWQLSLREMSRYTEMAFYGMAAMAIIAGAVADNLIARGFDVIKIRKGFTLAGLFAASSEVIALLIGSKELALWFVVISLTGLGIATANYWALTQSLMPGAAIGRIAGVQNFASNLSGIAAPLITGWLKQLTGSYQPAIWANFVILLIGASAYIFLVRPKYAPSKKETT